MRRTNMLPYSTQSVNDADVRAVARSLRSPYLTGGPAVLRFEKELCKIAGTRFAVAVNSGTAALHAAYAAAGILEGDEVLVPALTFAATANAALYLGAKPVFVDVETTTGTISLKDAERKLTRKTKAIVVVDYAGRPSELSEFRKFAQTHKLVLIADAAQSLGARYKGRPAGTFADMATYSFHPVKSITTGEGGAVVTNNSLFAERLRLFRTHGIAKNSGRLSRKGAWVQEMRMLGYNYRMPDILAALGASQLKRLLEFIDKRRKKALIYDKLLRGVQGVVLPEHDSKNVRSAWHLYALRVKDPGKRKKVFDHLRGAGIGVQVHHVPVYLHPYYRKLGFEKGLCPRAEAWYAQEISLPLFPAITEKEQRFVVEALIDALA